MTLKDLVFDFLKNSKARRRRRIKNLREAIHLSIAEDLSSTASPFQVVKINPSPELLHSYEIQPRSAKTEPLNEQLKEVFYVV